MAKSTSQSLKEYLRGIIGGLLFSLPLLYTMEVWWAGFLLTPLQLLAGLLATTLLLLGYNFYVGIRKDEQPIEVLIESVEELGLGLITSALVLAMLGRIKPGMGGEEVLGRIVVEAMAVAIGVSVGTAQLGARNPEEQKEVGVRGIGSRNTFGSRLVLGLCGAVLFSLNVAPTEEIVVIALESEVWNLLGIAGLSLVIGALILYYADFHGTQPETAKEPLSRVFAGTIIMYAIALVSSGFVLWFFGRFGGVALETALAETVVLGFTGMLGATAGRLLLST